MKRDKLYTINKGNKPIFAQGVDRVNHNIFDGEFGSYMNNAYNPQIGSPLFRNNSTANPFGITLSAPTNSPYINWSSPSQRLLASWQTQTLANSIGNSNFDLNKSNQQLSNQITTNAGSNKWSDDLTGAVATGIGTVGTMAGNAIGKGYESSAADAFGTVASAGLGIAGTALFGPVGGAIGSAVGSVLGGAAHKLIGMKTDQEALSKAKAGTSYYNNFKSNAATFDAVQGPQTQLAITNPYKGGLLKKGKAKRMNNALRKDRAEAFEHAFGEVDNNVGNLVNEQMNNLLSQSFAFGGALDLMQSNNYIDAINNRSNAIAKNNMQPYSSPSLFGPRELYSCGGQIKPNKYEFGGLEASFVDNFAKDPLAAVLDYNRGIEQRAAAKEASEAAAAQEAMINELKLGLQKAQTENEGLWAMYGDQQKTLNSLLESSRYSAPYPTTSESEEGDLISGIANSGAKVVRDVMAGNNGGADDYRNLKEFIKKHESFVPKAYQLKGEAHPTIGYGFYDVYPGTNRKVKAGDTITKAEADKYLDAAIRNLDNILAPKVPNWSKMTNNQRDAIRDLAFGTGPYAAHFKPNSRLFQALRREDWAAAEKELRSKSASLDIYNKGLAKRSDRRQAMWRAGDYSVKAFGGELGTNGSDFTNGLLEINAGGSHEDNPFEGVQLGVDQNGVPNLVEEGETVFNDYVFSKRMVVPDFMKKQLGLGSAKDDITFADASKKIAQESVERPNDPISQAGLEAGLAKLAEIQETERMRMQAEQENADMEMSMMQGLSAYGGRVNKFDDGGIKQGLYNLLGLKTQDDWNTWAKQNNFNDLIDFEDWNNILKNQAFVNAITKNNPALADAISRGYDFGQYKAPSSKYDLDAFDDVLSAYTKSTKQGNTEGKYAIDNNFGLGNYRTIKDLENSPEYKAYTQYLIDAANRMKGIKARRIDRNKSGDYDNLEFKDGNTFTKEDYDIISTLANTVAGTRTKSAGEPVPLFDFDEYNNGWLGLRDDAADTILRLRNDQKGGIFHLTPTRQNRNSLAKNYVINDDGTIEALKGNTDGFTLDNTYRWADAQNDYTNNYYRRSGNALGVGPLASAAPYERQSGISYYGPGVGNKSYYEAAMETGFGGQDTNWEGSTAPIFVPAERDEAALNTQVPYRIQDEAAAPAQQSTPASADITEKQPKPYQTWMRYAPIVGTGIATMTDLLGLTNKDDFSDANKIEALAERAGYAPNIRAPYIGDYMRDTPFDRLFYANQMQANSRATDRGLMNTSGGNRGAAQAGMLANGYNSQLGLGNLYRQAEEYNRGQYERTKAFNRGTNQFNAQMGLEADMANARYRQMASQYQMQGLGQAVAMKQAERARNSAARSANFTKLLNNLGLLGSENFALNQILSSRDANNGYYTDNKGIVYHNGKAYAEVKNPSAFGGEVERYLKNKKKVRRSK